MTPPRPARSRSRPAPPTVRRGPARATVLIACGVALAALLLIVVLNLEHPAEQAALQFPGDDTMKPVQVPQAIDPDDLRGRARSSLNAPGDLAPLLEEGTWIQIANERGELAQQYRCDRLTPSPGNRAPGWFEMDQPEAEVYLSDNRVVTLSGSKAIAYAPSRALESGTITDNVRIRLFEPKDDGTIDVEHDAPSLEVRTDEASFDNVSGEMRCAGEVEIETPQLYLPGRHLRILFDDQQDQFRLRLDTVDFVRLVSGPSDAATGPSGSAPPGTASPGSADDPGQPTARPAPVVEDRGPSMVDETFYLLTLTDNVRIVNGSEPAAQIVTADDLSILFTFRSKGFGPAFASARPAAAGALAGTAPIANPDAVAAFGPEVALGSVAATSDGARVAMITCTGPMTIVPVTDPDRQLASPSDALMTLTGPPVLLVDQSSDTTVECAELRYLAEASADSGRVETIQLLGSPSFPLSIMSPEVSGRADWLWIRPGPGTGRIEGAGWMLWRESLVARLRAAAERGEPMQVAAPPDLLDAVPSRQLRLTWSKGVDLAFEAPAEGGGLGPLRKASFDGDVRADSDEFRLTAEQLAATFGVGDDGAQSIRGIHANGNVKGQAQNGRDGHVVCRELDLQLLPGPDGQPTPSRLLAEGDVRAAETGQTIWADRLEASFAAPDGSEVAAADSRATVETVLATGNVQIHLDDGTRVLAERLDADAPARTAEISGDEIMLVRDGSMIDQTSRLVIEDRAGQYLLAGPGRLRVFDRPILGAGTERLQPQDIATADGLLEQLRVTWTELARLDDRSTPAAPRARIATFRGDVRAHSDSLDLEDADRVVARFLTGADGTASIDGLDAYGRPAPEQNDDPDDATELEPLHLTLRGRGEPAPDAAGDAAPIMAEQNLWASTVHTTFLPASKSTTGSNADRAGAVEIDTFTAKRQVRIRRDDGSIVLADEIRGHGTSRSADLFGAPILVVSDSTLLECEPKATLIDRDGEYQLVGPGRLRMFDGPIALGDDHRPIAADLEPRQPQLTAQWTESALYVQPREDAYATIDLRGSVHVEARPTVLEEDRIDADSLTLEFDDSGRARSAAARSGSTTVDGAGNRLARLIARGDARLENVSWRNEADVGDDSLARVFYVAGQHVLYDDRSGEALVAGDGELLIHDPRPGDPADPDADPASFSNNGTTLFRFTRKLQMTPAVDEFFDIVMSGDVEMLHRNINNETATLTGEQIQARVKRSRDVARSEQFDFGGHATLQHIRGIGNIFIRTATRDVRCDEFFYGMDRMAELKARTGRRVAVKTRGAGEAMLAEHVLWDMVNDTILTRGVTGSSSR